MKLAICKHCGKEIGLWWEEYGESQQVWMHYPNDGPDAYRLCLGFENDEEAEPKESVMQ